MDAPPVKAARPDGYLVQGKNAGFLDSIFLFHVIS